MSSRPEMWAGFCLSRVVADDANSVPDFFVQDFKVLRVGAGELSAGLTPPVWFWMRFVRNRKNF
jgi:hypothetical protein